MAYQIRVLNGATKAQIFMPAFDSSDEAIADFITRPNSKGMRYAADYFIFLDFGRSTKWVSDKMFHDVEILLKDKK